ncbi:MAG: family 20 glycosylhydrolase [Clostridia bacterium]|nr:family 20 glycosylhydrolase [Clostridia bacterium]
MIPDIVPQPKQFVLNGGQTRVYPAEVRLVPPCTRDAAAAVRAFAGYALKLGIKVKTVRRDAAISIVIDPNGRFRREGYRIDIGKRKVAIAAADSTGLNRALATLLQLAGTAESGKGIVLPECRIRDWADSEYRGMMVDLARYWHPFKYVLSYVDMCWYYKVSVLHLHFTDDQSYTLPSRLYPKLATPGRSYTFEELAELEQYACDRGVQIMPEIDVPGHNTGFALAYPELFGKNGIICQHKDSVDAVAALFGELCETFPRSKRIHIGGDEANLKKWLECPECMAYAKALGIDTESEAPDAVCDKLYVNFIVRMADAVRTRGRTPIVWEGFPKAANRSVPKYIVVMSWENFYQVTPDLLAGGFRIINCSWNPMYIVAPDVKWTPAEVCDWSIYKWRPVHPGSPYIGRLFECAPDKAVLGGQLLAWGDRVPAAYADNTEEGARVERVLLAERLPYLAQNTWNIVAGVEYNKLAESVKTRAAELDIIIN